ncbi:MAG TPA: carbon storage regulator CsrA [Myxococcota bacterium]
MLVLTRREGETIRIGGEVRITVVSISPTSVRIAVAAPEHVPVHREEVFQRIEEANREAARAAREARLPAPAGAAPEEAR